jgi:hypothetical protein
MKVIIAGGRGFHPTIERLRKVVVLLESISVSEVVSGGAEGADAWGEKIADLAGLPVRTFPANWTRLGLEAGHVRNLRMADYADALIALPGGRGTADMIKAARDRDLLVFLPG